MSLEKSLIIRGEKMNILICMKEGSIMDVINEKGQSCNYEIVENNDYLDA